MHSPCFVVVEPTHLKNMLVKLDHFPKDRDKHKRYLSCHHLACTMQEFKPFIHVYTRGRTVWTVTFSLHYALRIRYKCPDMQQENMCRRQTVNLLCFGQVVCCGHVGRLLHPPSLSVPSCKTMVELQNTFVRRRSHPKISFA